MWVQAMIPVTRKLGILLMIGSLPVKSKNPIWSGLATCR
jgi:hypothetical protein